MVNPAKLAWGLRAAVERRGGTDRSRGRASPGCGDGPAAWTSQVDGWRRGRGGAGPRRHVRVQRLAAAPGARVRARLRLRADDRADDRPRSARRSAGAGREGLSDAGNQFHYFRLSRRTTGCCGAATTRSTTRATASIPAHDRRPATFETLARTLRGDVPAARRDPVHAPLGRGDRHHDAVPRDVRRGAGRARALRAGLHGPGRGRDALGGRDPAGHASCDPTRRGCGCGSCARGRSPSRRSPSGRRPWS